MNKTEAAHRKEELLKELAECEQVINSPSSILSELNLHTDVRGSLIFASRDECQLLCEALTTFLDLRRMEGSEKPRDGDQYIVGADGKSHICNDWRKSLFISPMFNTLENARKAIDTIGADRIRQMFNVLHGVTE